MESSDKLRSMTFRFSAEPMDLGASLEVIAGTVEPVGYQFRLEAPGDLRARI